MTLNEIISDEAKISIEMPELKRGEKALVTYNGMLSNKGAEEIYLHYGHDGWHDTTTVPMSKTNSGNFITNIRVTGNEEINFCFKDNENNWDNNNGSDWKVDIE